MTATQRIRSMLDGSPVKEIGACGWLHTIGADRDTAEVFSSAIIKMTDYSKWDFIKVMPNGVYNQEAHGSDIEYFSGPLSVEDLKAKRVFQFHRYLINSVSLTRGPLGIMAIPKPSFLGFEITTPRQFYFMILVLVALSTLVVSNLMKSRVGYAILAIRDDELAAEAMGIHVFRYKMIVFILSSLLVGLAGAFYATYTSYIDPSSFAAAQSNDMLVMVIFGGLGNTVGSFIGAISLSILPEALRDLAQYRQLIYGVLLVLLMMVKPQGLLGDINFKYIRQRMEHREKSKEAANE